MQKNKDLPHTKKYDVPEIEIKSTFPSPHESVYDEEWNRNLSAIIYIGKYRTNKLCKEDASACIK